MPAVTDEMVLALSATGTPDDIALRLDALLQAALKQAVLFPIWADGDAKKRHLADGRVLVLTTPLDNPVWRALTGPHAELALGREQARLERRGDGIPVGRN
jgi:hypothetical protein